jgi:hypothetical protein
MIYLLSNLSLFALISPYLEAGMGGDLTNTLKVTHALNFWCERREELIPEIY